MDQSQLNWIAGYIWGIADDVLRDLYVRGKYRDVILPMTVLRRLDALLEPAKAAVLDMKASLDKAGVTNQDAALRQASGQAFYNTSKFATHLYGQEINAETYAICKADLLLKGEGEAADNIIGGPEYSTLANDAFRSREFDFMISNPPYGKSWKSDQERMGGKASIKDPRFIVEHAGDPEFSLVTRSSDGQMLFLANMVSKMKHGSKLGSRIAQVHNGSSLFTGDAGQGESNIRR